MVNRAFAEAYKTNQNEILANDDYDLGAPHDYITGNKDKNIEGIRKSERIALTGKTIKTENEIMLLPSGELKTYESLRTPLFDDDGGVIAIICFSREK